MKFVVLIAIVFAVIWFMRNARRFEDRPREDRTARRPPPPQEMVECAVCHVHLPRSDALPGPGGQLYCCAEHRQKAGA
jgi:uncharacterized protein